VTTQALTETGERAARNTRLFGIAVLATLVVTALELPWRLSGLAFGGVAVYAGVRLLSDLSAMRRTGRPAPGRVGVIVGIGLTGLLMLLLLGEAALYPWVAEQDRCLARAITHADQEQCHLQLDRHQQDLLRRLGGRAEVSTP
jgi:hypothetical protein